MSKQNENNDRIGGLSREKEVKSGAPKVMIM